MRRAHFDRESKYQMLKMMEQLPGGERGDRMFAWLQAEAQVCTVPVLP